MERKLFHSKKETAVALGVSERTIDNMVQRDQIPSIKIGTRRLFDLSEVVAALKAGAAVPEK